MTGKQKKIILGKQQNVKLKSPNEKLANLRQISMYV